MFYGGDRIIVRDASLLHPKEFTKSIAKSSLGDFNDIFSYHGLQVQEVFGDYQLGSYHIRNKTRLIIIAGKK